MRVFNYISKITVLALSSIWLWSSVAAAQPKERYVTIDANISSYKALVQKAETAAKQSVEQAFQDNSTLDSVTVMILGERGGQTVPILRTRVTRSQWQANRDVSEWTRYFPPSQSLLGYRDNTPPPESPSRSTPRTRPQPTSPATRSQPSTVPVPPTPTTSQTVSPQTPPQPTVPTQTTSPQTPPASDTPNIIRLEPRSTPRSRPTEDDPGFRDD